MKAKLSGFVEVISQNKHSKKTKDVLDKIRIRSLFLGNLADLIIPY